MNFFSPVSGFLQRATYHNALDHLLIILVSTVLLHVQRITALKGSALLSN